MIIKTNSGEEFELTPDEIKFVKALNRLDKLNQGRIILFANGRIGMRMNQGYYNDEFDFLINVKCDGGDGGDNS